MPSEEGWTNPFSAPRSTGTTNVVKFGDKTRYPPPLLAVGLTELQPSILDTAPLDFMSQRFKKEIRSEMDIATKARRRQVHHQFHR